MGTILTCICVDEKMRPAEVELPAHCHVAEKAVGLSPDSFQVHAYLILRLHTFQATGLLFLIMNTQDEPRVE